MRTQNGEGRGERHDGFATVVVLALVVLMVVFVVSTQRTLARVKEEVRRMELRHETRQREAQPVQKTPEAGVGEEGVR